MSLFPMPDLPGAPQIGGNNWYVDADYFVGQKEVPAAIDQYFGDKKPDVRTLQPSHARSVRRTVLFPGINR